MKTNKRFLRVNNEVGFVYYGMGNISCLQNAISELGSNSSIIVEPSELLLYEKIILPSVGAFGDAIKSIKIRGFLDPLNAYCRLIEMF